MRGPQMEKGRNCLAVVCNALTLTQNHPSLSRARVYQTSRGLTLILSPASARLLDASFRGQRKNPATRTCFGCPRVSNSFKARKGARGRNVCLFCHPLSRFVHPSLGKGLFQLPNHCCCCFARERKHGIAINALCTT